MGINASKIKVCHVNGHNAVSFGMRLITAPRIPEQVY